MPERELTWKKQERGAELLVAIRGGITEDATFEKLIAEIGTPAVTFDLGEVKHINSLGVREWLGLIRTLVSKGITIALERCPVIIVHQLNMIVGFDGGGAIRSVYAPYFCPACEREELVLVDLQAVSASVLPEAVVCKGCGTRMELDDLPEHYEALARGFSRA